MDRLTTLTMRLECTFHNYFAFSLLISLAIAPETFEIWTGRTALVSFRQQVTTPTVRERTAKVRVGKQTRKRSRIILPGTGRAFYENRGDK